MTLLLKKNDVFAKVLKKNEIPNTITTDFVFSGELK